MFGVTSAEVFANLEVGGCPEAAEVFGDLHRTVIGAEEMKENRHAATGKTRGLGPAEQFLKPDGQPGRFARLVGEPNAIPARDD